MKYTEKQILDCLHTVASSLDGLHRELKRKGEHCTIIDHYVDSAHRILTQNDPEYAKGETASIFKHDTKAA